MYGLGEAYTQKSSQNLVWVYYLYLITQIKMDR